MKKTTAILLLTLSGIRFLSAQSITPSPVKPVPVSSQAISASFLFPLGNFSETHFPGADLTYHYSRHRLGLLPKKPAQRISFAGQGGVAYYFGKNVTVSGYPYKNPGYFYLHASGGILYASSRKTNFTLHAGPGLGIYRGRARITIGASLDGNYYFHSRYGFGPVLLLLKESGADPLWSAGLRGMITF